MGDAVPEAIGVISHPTNSSAEDPAFDKTMPLAPSAEVDILFERGTPVPGMVRRTYTREAITASNVDLTILQRESPDVSGKLGSWRSCLQLLQVMTTSDDDMQDLQ